MLIIPVAHHALAPRARSPCECSPGKRVVCEIGLAILRFLWPIRLGVNTRDACLPVVPVLTQGVVSVASEGLDGAECLVRIRCGHRFAPVWPLATL